MNTITPSMLDAAHHASPFVARVCARAIYIAMEHARLVGERTTRNDALARRQRANSPWPSTPLPPASATRQRTNSVCGVPFPPEPILCAPSAPAAPWHRATRP